MFTKSKVQSGVAEMVRIICAGLAIVVMASLSSRTAEAQVVTSYYAGPAAVVPTAAPVVAAPVVTSPVVTSPVVGTIPMRRGLFGWRTENVPVLAPGAVVAPVPVATTPVVAGTAYQAARPVYTAAPLVTSPAVPTSTYVPNAVVTSGYRGTAVPLPAVPVVPTVPLAPVQVNTFYPGAVMTMQ
ncbi:MAG: hypothetical protein ACO1RT_19185 [Planctomycetaceae bacterium]